MFYGNQPYIKLPNGKFQSNTGKIFDDEEQAMADAMNPRAQIFESVPNTGPISTARPTASPQQKRPSIDAPMESSTEPMSRGGLLSMLSGGDSEGVSWRDAAGAAGNAFLAMSGNPNLARMGMYGMERADALRDKAIEKKAEQAKINKTVKVLREMERDDLADAVENGLMSATEAAAYLFGQAKDERTSALKEYEYAKSQGYTGSFTDYKSDLARAGATNVTVGGSNESELAKSLAKKRGDQFASYLTAGDKAAALMPELQTLEQLSSMAPNGPIVGRVAELFPEFNDASAAFMSMVQRIAPTMRVEGSGSTSDIEFNAMLRSLGSLRNAPEANKMIYDAFRKKALLDQARAQVVTMYENGEYDLAQARTKLGELNKQNILSDQLRSAIEGSDGPVVPSGTGNKPANMSKELWEVMTPQERALFN